MIYKFKLSNLFVKKNTFRAILIALFLSLNIFTWTACTSHQTAISTEEIAIILGGFGRDWHQLHWQEEQLILLQPYEGVNTQFNISEDFESQQWTIHLKKEFTETFWLISSLEKKDNQYIFNLINKEDASQKTAITYDVYSLQRKVGQWEEVTNDLFFGNKPLFFTQKTTLWLFEEIFSLPTNQNLVIETEMQNEDTETEQEAEKDLKSTVQSKKTPIQKEKKAQWFRFSGGIGTAYYPITAFFCINDDSQNLEFLKGRYYYDKVWVDLGLIPVKQNQNTWKLQEYSSLTPKKTTGFFLGDLSNRHHFSGYWHSANGQKTLAFDMEEKGLPYTLEDWQEEGENYTISFPQFPNQADNPAFRSFNVDFIKNKLKIWKNDFPDFDKVDYDLLFANQNLISIVFRVEEKGHILAIYCLNFDLEEAKEVKLTHLFDIENDFEDDFFELLNRSIGQHNKKYATSIPSLSQDIDLMEYNFIEKNIRILIFDRKNTNYIPFYIPYQKLEKHTQKSTLERYHITQN